MDWLQLVGQVGFPAAVAIYLLVKFDKTLSNLTGAIRDLAEIVRRDKGVVPPNFVEPPKVERRIV